MTEFVFLFSLPRSGSHVFCDLVGKHPSIEPVSEAFHTQLYTEENNLFWFVLRHCKTPGDVIDYIYRYDLLEDYKEYLTNKYPNSLVMLDIKVVSLHHFNGPYFHPTSHPELLRKIDIFNPKFVYLKREKLTRLYFSNELAKRRQKWHYVDGEEDPQEVEAFVINTEEACEELLLMREDRLFIEKFLASRSAESVIEIPYESVVNPETGEISAPTAQQLAKFLNINQEFQGKTIYRRSTTVTPRKFIKNYDELESALRAVGVWDELLM